MSVPFPMPNDEIEDRIVVASVVYIDDELATVLLLNPESPFFSVAHYAYGDNPLAGRLEVLSLDDGDGGLMPATFLNIVPAVRAYEQWGGDY